MDKVRIVRSRTLLRTQRWWWVREAGNGEVLSRSSEGYRDYDEARRKARRCNSSENVEFDFPDPPWKPMGA